MGKGRLYKRRLETKTRLKVANKKEGAMKNLLMAFLLVVSLLTSFSALAEEPIHAQLDEFNKLVKSGAITKANFGRFLETNRPATSTRININADALPATMTVAGRTYDILGFLKGDEKSVTGSTMVKRVKKMNANLGQDDGEHLLKHQDQIPVQLRGRVVFVFTDWRHPVDYGNVAYVYWIGGRWIRGGDWLGNGAHWGGLARVLRRKCNWLF
ncbi:MAG: hypothetical protein Q8M83_03485 [bacterium]|nr:hypothetical protein [bacterium]